MSTYPRFFREGCCALFGLDAAVEDDAVIDAYWRVSRSMIYQALWTALNEKTQDYLPQLQIPAGMTWLTYAEQLAEVAEAAEVDEPAPAPKDAEPFSPITLPHLALTGLIGHGKSTVAAYLCQRHGYTEYAFARPLKEGVRRLFRLSPAQVYTEQKDQVDPRWGVAPRYILQQLGTELFRAALPTYLPTVATVEGFWIRNFQRWFSFSGCYRRVVISDCRFPDEARALHGLGFHLLRVTRGVPKNPPMLHSSEQHTLSLQVHGELDNTGTLADLYQRVETILSTLE